jgi:hypothetical protein
MPAETINKLAKAGLADPTQLRAEADKVRELIERIDAGAMPALAALLRERAAICEALADRNGRA